MSLHTDLYAVLASTTGLPALYPGFAPQAAPLPYVVMARTGTDRIRDLGAGRSLAGSEWQFDVIALTMAEKEAAWEVLEGALEGLNAHKTYGSTRFHTVRVDNRFDADLPPVDGSDQPRRRTVFLVHVWAEEPIGG